MGTKNNPGKFDCYDKAEPDEPMFVILGRDPVARMVVLEWARLRLRFGYNQPHDPQMLEAAECARAMGIYEADRSIVREAKPEPEWCRTCGRHDRAVLLARNPDAVMGERRGSDVMSVGVLCPHCGYRRYIPTVDALWFCDCQVCSCDKATVNHGE